MKGLVEEARCHGITHRVEMMELIEADEEKKMLMKVGFFGTIGFGKTPAVVIIDIQKSHTDPASPLATPRLDEPIRNIKVLIKAARKKNVPIVYVGTQLRKDGADATVAERAKSPVIEIEKTKWVEIDERIKPEENDFYVVKKCADAFFSTALDNILRTLGVDTLIVTGCSTSHCVRATVEHSSFLGYRTIVPKECVGDRAAKAHEQNLIDMDSAYADVMPLSDVIEYFAKLRTQNRNIRFKEKVSV
jgi:maleamate amidohydrolase